MRRQTRYVTLPNAECEDQLFHSCTNTLVCVSVRAHSSVIKLRKDHDFQVFNTWAILVRLYFHPLTLMTLHITWTRTHNFITTTIPANTWQLSPVLSTSSSFYMQVVVLTWKLCVCVFMLLGTDDSLCLCQICSSDIPQVFTPSVSRMWYSELWYCVVLLADSVS